MCILHAAKAMCETFCKVICIYFGLHVAKNIFLRDDTRHKSIPLPFLTAPTKWLQKAQKDPQTELSVRIH